MKKRRSGSSQLAGSRPKLLLKIGADYFRYGFVTGIGHEIHRTADFRFLYDRTQSNLPFSDTDFYHLDVSRAIDIKVTFGNLPDHLKDLDVYGD
jgi:hypothetical protein